MKPNYLKYIQSEEWAKKTAKWKKDAKCERCKSPHDLTCHHKHYNTLGYEARWDVKVLCWRCHLRHHRDIDGNRINNEEYKKKLQVFKDRKNKLTPKKPKKIARGQPINKYKPKE